MTRPRIVRAVETDERLLALTFDDGPADVTPELLDLLGGHGAHATFFVLGRSIPGREETLVRALREGHELGNHLFSHEQPGRLDDAAVRAELEGTQALVEQATGFSPRLVRPPYGQAERVARLAASLGLAPTVLWSVDPRDWEAPPAETIVERVLAGLRPGAIVDLHDGWGLTPGDRRSTAAAVKMLLPELAALGYGLVTVSELLAVDSPGATV